MADTPTPSATTTTSIVLPERRKPTQKELVAQVLADAAPAPVEAWQLRQVAVLLINAGWRVCAADDPTPPPPATLIEKMCQAYRAGFEHAAEEAYHSCPDCDYGLEEATISQADVVASVNTLITARGAQQDEAPF